MASTFAEVKQLIDSSIGSLTDVTIVGDSTMRGTSGATTNGLFISRIGTVTGSASASLTITLEGGSADWSGALSQTNVDAYYTRAQTMILSSIIDYIKRMSDAYIENNLYG